MKGRLPLLSALLLASSCIPSFDDVDCYSDIDCPGRLVCSPDGRCVAGLPDSGTDAGGSDASDTGGPDVPTPDTGMRDQGVDGGPPDNGVVDTGADTGVVDTGPVDMGVGDAGMANISVSPTMIDFGVARANCAPSPGRIDIQNLGNSPVTVRSIQPTASTSAEYQVSNTQTPFVLNASQTAFVQLGYRPVNEGVDLGAIDIAVEGAPVSRVTLTGAAQFQPNRVETFRQTGGPIDILFVIDDSDNMSAFQEELINEVSLMVLLLNFEGWDFQIGVISTGIAAPSLGGQLIGNPPFLRATDPNYETLLEARIRAGEAGDPNPRGLLAMRNALTPPLSTGANAGFLRPEAALMVVLLGSEEDGSPGVASTYSAFLNGLKADNTRVVANSITTDFVQCNVGGDTAASSVRFDIVAIGTGGTFSEICQSDYTLATESLPADAREQFLQLTSDVDPASLVVRADGAIMPTATYDYNITTRQLRFTTGNAPAPGVQVTVAYNIQCN